MSAGADIPPDFLEASKRYVLSTEALLAELGPDAEPPRSIDRLYLRRLIGRPDQGLECE